MQSFSHMIVNTVEIWQFLFVLVTVLLSASDGRFSVSNMQDIYKYYQDIIEHGTNKKFLNPYAKYCISLNYISAKTKGGWGCFFLNHLLFS